MGSPTSGILSGVFLQEMEEKHFHKLKLKYNINMISRYVDDILIIYNDDKYNEERIVKELNTLHKNIEITYEMETNNRINYLHLTQEKNFKTNKIKIGIYRKPSSNTIVIHRK